MAGNWADPGFIFSITANPQRRWTPEETIEFVKDNCQPAFGPGNYMDYANDQDRRGSVTSEYESDLLPMLDPISTDGSALVGQVCRQRGE